MTDKPPPSWWPRDPTTAIDPRKPLGSQQWEFVEEPLSLEKLYDLCRIAHETKDPQVKAAAITTLMRSLHPAVRSV